MDLQNIGGENKDDALYRYKMPKMVTKIESRGNGVKTNIVNMGDIAKALDRPPSYVIHYFCSELGAHDTAKLAGLLDNFIKKFIQCYGCGNPETAVMISKSDKVNLKCAACSFVSEKLTKFIIIKNHPDMKKGSKDKKSRRAEKRRLIADVAEETKTQEKGV